MNFFTPGPEIHEEDIVLAFTLICCFAFPQCKCIGETYIEWQGFILEDFVSIISK